jgi:hypothetical protein
MSTLTDKFLLRFLDNVFIKDFLENQLGLASLFNQTYAVNDIEIKELAFTQLRNRQFQVPVFETIRTSGTEERIAPTHERVKVDHAQPRYGRLVWVDVLMEVALTAKVYDKGAAVDRITTRNLIDVLGGVSSMTDLITKLATLYPQSIVNAFFTELNIKSIEDFKRRGNVMMDFFYKAPPPYDPNNPQNVRSYTINVCVQLQPDVGVADALQKAKLSRSILENERDFVGNIDGGEIVTPYAFVISIPDSQVKNESLPGMKIADIKAGLKALFAEEKILAHFFVDK